jgi:hypothetical protein
MRQKQKPDREGGRLKLVETPLTTERGVMKVTPYFIIPLFM